MPVPKPVIVYVGTNGQNISPGALKPQAVVMHVMQGTLHACDAWFANPAAQASANYGVGRDGTIHCYVDPDSGSWAWANGLINNPDASVQKLLAANPGINPNRYTIAIEHEGWSGTPLTPQQLDASAHLCAWLLDRYGIPFDEDHLLGHYEFDSVTRAGCPGWDRAGWLAYEAAVQRWLHAGPDLATAVAMIQQAQQSLERARAALGQ